MSELDALKNVRELLDAHEVPSYIRKEFSNHYMLYVYPNMEERDNPTFTRDINRLNGVTVTFGDEYNDLNPKTPEGKSYRVSGHQSDGMMFHEEFHMADAGNRVLTLLRDVAQKQAALKK